VTPARQVIPTSRASEAPERVVLSATIRGAWDVRFDPTSLQIGRQVLRTPSSAPRGLGDLGTHDDRGDAVWNNRVTAATQRTRGARKHRVLPLRTGRRSRGGDERALDGARRVLAAVRHR
jgi:hypothetical protein